MIVAMNQSVRLVLNRFIFPNRMPVKVLQPASSVKRIVKRLQLRQAIRVEKSVESLKCVIGEIICNQTATGGDFGQEESPNKWEAIK